VRSGNLILRRWAYRRWQTAVLFGLAVLVVTGCAAGPFYERAVEQATVHSTLGGAPRVDRGMSVDLAFGTPAARLVPSGAAAALFETPVSGIDVPSGLTVKGVEYHTTLSYRDGYCAHLHLIAGRCPTGPWQVVMSASSARAVDLRAGQRFGLHLPGPNSYPPVTITGLYTPFTADDDYWFGRSYYSSVAGIREDDAGHHADTAFGSQQFVAHEAAAGQQYVTNGNPNPFLPDQFVDVPLRPDRVGLDQLPVLRATRARLSGLTATSGVYGLTTALPNLLDQVDGGRRQARSIVLALAAQLALLALIAFGVVVAAAVDQRRTELALARLRGRGRRQAALVVVREVGGLVILAVVPGLLLAWLGTAVACRWWLVAGVRPEWRWPVLAVAAGAVALAALIAAAVALRTARAPITELLRDVAPPRRLRGLGVAEAAIGAAAVAGLVAILGGSRHNALATVSPTLLAVLAGLIAGRIAVTVASTVGRRAFWRHRLVPATAALTIARRSGHRLAITALCVASALVVFAGQQWSVAAANRNQRALAENGAPVVLAVSTPDLRTLVSATHAADPGGSYATPVIDEEPPGTEATRMVAVEPSSFARIASWGRASERPSEAELSRLAPVRAPTITVTGTTLTVRLAAAGYTKIPTNSPVPDLPGEDTPPPPPIQVSLELVLRGSDGVTQHASFGLLPAGLHRNLVLHAPVECAAGCRVIGVDVDRGALDSAPVTATADLLSVQGDGGPQPLGSANNWRSTTPSQPLFTADGSTSMRILSAGQALRFVAQNDGDLASAQYLNEPIALPALAAGALPDARDALGYLTVTSIDGSTARITPIGATRFVPGVGSEAVLVDLNAAATQSGGLQGAAAIWLGRDDPGRERQLTTTLAHYKITVVQRTTSAQKLSEFTHSAPAWSAQLTIVVAVLSALIATALLVLVVTSSRRARVRDLSALRLVGVSGRQVSRAQRLELLVVVAVGVLVGVAIGLIGVRLALPSVPIFSSVATVPLPVALPIVWTWLLASAVAVAVLLAVTAVVVATRVAAAARADEATGERA
jgi:putative ABC transport system permease protein